MLAAFPFLTHPVAALGIQCGFASLSLGLRTKGNPWWTSLATVPVQIGCVGLIIYKGRNHVRPAWAAWLASFSSFLLFRSLDQSFLERSRRNDEVPGRPRSGRQKPVPSQARSEPQSLATRLWSAFNALVGFRQLGSSQEAKNSPPFSYKDIAYVPPRGRFLLNSVVRLSLCYLTIDVLSSSPPPPTAVRDFAPHRMSLFTRLRSVKSDEVVLRSILPFSVFAVGYCMLDVIYQSMAFAAAASGLYPPESWQPLFGPLSSTCTLRGFWGHFWHQNFRVTLTNWSSYIVHDILALPKTSSENMAWKLITRYSKIAIVFLLSGLVHRVADVAAGLPSERSCSIQFFLWQSVGIMLEDAIEALYTRAVHDLIGEKQQKANITPLWARCLGYVWVWSFMAWSVPLWIYPLAYYSASKGEPPRSLVPFSFVQWRLT